MKRLLALLLPLCLLLAGCSRNTQALQEEVDRLKQENTALLETIDQLQEQFSTYTRFPYIKIMNHLDYQIEDKDIN